jgi:hypothetical protein
MLYYRFETAVGIPVPYWDSTICFEMEDPVESEVWTEDYLIKSRLNTFVICKGIVNSPNVSG